MNLQSFFDKSAVRLDLPSGSKDEVLKELIRLIDVDDKSASILYKNLKRRENFGSTGIGRGIAIPHCRSMAVNRLKIAYARARPGVEYRALDGRPVHNFFLIVAPPNEVSNDYLPVLGKLAMLARQPDISDRLAALSCPEEFFSLLAERAI